MMQKTSGLAASMAKAAYYEKLLAAVLGHPQDISKRLELARWCEANGRGEEAALIRQERPPAGGYQTKVAREYRQLLHRHRYPFLKCQRVVIMNRPRVEGEWSVARMPTGDSYWCQTDRNFYMDAEHGFVTAVALRWGQFQKYAQQIFRANPIAAVFLFDRQSPADVVGKPKEMVPVEDGHRLYGPNDYWRSWTKSADKARSWAAVPRALWDRLDGFEEERTGRDGCLHRCYPDRPAARLALSRAAVAYGRELAATITEDDYL
jgi:hypothetical protein